MVGLGVAGFYAYRIARPMLDNAGDYIARRARCRSSAIASRTRRRIVPPKNGELTAAQVDRFLAVQARVRDELGDRWSDIETKSAEIRQKTEGNSDDWRSRRSRSIFSDIANIYVDARRAQVNALNIHKFSDGEYTWVTPPRLRSGRHADCRAVSTCRRSKTWRVKARRRRHRSCLTCRCRKCPRRTSAGEAARRQSKEWIPMAVLGL